MSAHLR